MAWKNSIPSEFSMSRLPWHARRPHLLALHVSIVLLREPVIRCLVGFLPECPPGRDTRERRRRRMGEEDGDDVLMIMTKVVMMMMMMMMSW